MFPPTRPKEKPRCGEAPAAPATASRRSVALSTASFINGKGSLTAVRRTILILLACTALAGCGAVTFASAGPNTRTTQVFINLGDNSNLDQTGFAPFGAVSSGMDVVDKLYSGYGDTPTAKQGEMETQGNAWLEKNYPKLDSIKTARVTQESNPALP